MPGEIKAAKDALDVGIVARDADRLVSFYRDVVGLEYVESFDSRVGRIHRLRFGASWFKIVSGSSAQAEQAYSFEDPGLRYVTFEIADIDDTWNRMVESGADVVAPLVTHPETGARAGSVRDPEGNVIEFLTRSG